MIHGQGSSREAIPYRELSPVWQDVIKPDVWQESADFVREHGDGQEFRDTVLGTWADYGIRDFGPAHANATLVPMTAVNERVGLLVPEDWRDGFAIDTAKRYARGQLVTQLALMRPWIGREMPDGTESPANADLDWDGMLDRAADVLALFELESHDASETAGSKGVAPDSSDFVIIGTAISCVEESGLDGHEDLESMFDGNPDAAELHTRQAADYLLEACLNILPPEHLDRVMLEAASRAYGHENPQ